MLIKKKKKILKPEAAALKSLNTLNQVHDTSELNHQGKAINWNKYIFFIYMYQTCKTLSKGYINT